MNQYKTTALNLSSDDGNNKTANTNQSSSNVQNISAMLAALTNSPSRINTINNSSLNSLNNSSIPSPQSAFALLTQKAAAAAAFNLANGIDLLSNDFLTTNNIASTSTTDTSNTPINSNSLLPTTPNHANAASFYSKQLQNSTFPQLITPLLNDTVSSKNLMPTEKVPAATDTAAAAFEQFSKIFGNVNLDPSSVLAKIQQQLNVESSLVQTYPTASFSNPNLATISNARIQSNKIGHSDSLTLHNLQQTILQQHSAFSNVQSQRQLMEQSLNQQRFGLGGARNSFDETNFGSNNILNTNNKISSLNELSQSNLPSSIHNMSTNEVPIRRIRRRRPKSPRPIKAINGLKTNGSSFETTNMEQQTVTSDDSVIHSPPSLLSFSLTNGMTIGDKDDIINKQRLGIMRNSLEEGMDYFGDNLKRSRKACLVCGDNATGYNFNVITCESCKAFFRRNALRPKEFKCPYSDNCDINTVSRRFCQKCRLKKCFNVGMKKEWILNDEQLKRRKNSRLHNSKNQGLGNNYMQTATPGSTVSTTPKSQMSACSGGSSDTTLDVNTTYNANNLNLPKDETNQLNFFNTNAVQRQSSANNAAASFFTTSRRSTELPVISPPSVQSMTSPTTSNEDVSPLIVGRNSTSESPTSSRNLNNLLPQIEPNDDQYNPNIMHIQTITSKMYSFPISAASQMTSSTANNCGSTSTAFSICENIGNLVNNNTLKPNEQLFPSAVEALFHKGEAKIALSLEDYQRLLRWNSTNLNTDSSPIVNITPLQFSSFEPINASTQFSNSSNLFSKLPPKTENNFVSSSPLSITTNTPSINQSFVNNAQLQASNSYIYNHLQNQQKNLQNFAFFSNQTSLNSPITSLNMPSQLPTPFSISPISSNRFSNQMLEMMNSKKKKHLKYMEITIQDELNNSCYNQDIPKSNMLQEVLFDDTKKNYQLNSLEQRELDIVRNAFFCMDEPLDLTNTAKVIRKPDHNPADIMNIMDITMRRYVKMAKKLSTFAELSQEGKLHLLKAAMINLLIIRGFSRLDSSRENFVSPVFGNAKLSCNFFNKLHQNTPTENFFKCSQLLAEIVRTNTTAISLICLITLFGHTSAITDENDKIIAKRHQEFYRNLLKRYLESIHGSEAAALLVQVDKVIAELSSMSTLASLAFMGRVKPGETEKLPMEFFKTSQADDVPISVVDESEDDTDVSSTALINEKSAMKFEAKVNEN